MNNLTPPFTHSGCSPRLLYAALALSALPPAAYAAGFLSYPGTNLAALLIFPAAGFFFGTVISGRDAGVMLTKYLLNGVLFLIITPAESFGIICLAAILTVSVGVEEFILRSPYSNPFPPFITAFLLFGAPETASLPAAAVWVALSGVIAAFILRTTGALTAVSAAAGAGLYMFFSGAGFPEAAAVSVIAAGYPGLLPAERLKRVLAAAALGAAAAGIGYRGMALAFIAAGVMEWF